MDCPPVHTGHPSKIPGGEGGQVGVSGRSFSWNVLKILKSMQRLLATRGNSIAWAFHHALSASVLGRHSAACASTPHSEALASARLGGSSRWHEQPALAQKPSPPKHAILGGRQNS